MVAWTAAESAEPLTDKEKKAAVYRMYNDYKLKDFPNVEDILPGEAMAMMTTRNVVFVDTRKPAERAVSTLPGAISRDAFEAHPERYRDALVIAYCTISYRSGLFSETMAERGLPVLNLAGGILAWTLEGGQVVDGGGETRRIHVYGKEWDLAPDGYETVMFGPLDRWL
jgi:sodium/bile acid cotransporter 7